MARAYYNEFDHAAAHILRALVDDGVLAPGDVDTRSIKEVMPDDLDGYTQCHFFAGGGLWSVAARLAGWSDDRPLWTGSCPCQPFSAAGKGFGTDDPRHLWPDFHRLISARRPAVVMGEQVAGAPGYGWFDGVRSDLEGEGYASRAVDFPACSVNAPHQRNRIYWIALEHAAGERRGEGRAEPELRSGWPTPAGSDASVDLADGASFGREVSTSGRKPAVQGTVSNADSHGGVSPDATVALVQGQPSARHQSDHRADAGVHADADRGGRTGRAEGEIGREVERTASKQPLLRNGTYWSDAEWIACHDGKARRAQSGIRFLVDGLPGRVDLWRVGGNAIVPEAAAEVIAAYLDTERAAA